MKCIRVGVIPRPAHKYRSRIQIIAAVLSLSAGGASQTDIAGRAKLNCRQVTAYLDWLLEVRLLETIFISDNCVLYKTTPKGNRLLTTLSKIQKLLGEPDYLNIAPAHLIKI